jgi:hypothetical protein
VVASGGNARCTRLQAMQFKLGSAFLCASLGDLQLE